MNDTKNAQPTLIPIGFWVKRLLESLPDRRDWLDPVIERNLRAALEDRYALHMPSTTWSRREDDAALISDLCQVLKALVDNAFCVEYGSWSLENNEDFDVEEVINKAKALLEGR